MLSISSSLYQVITLMAITIYSSGPNWPLVIYDISVNRKNGDVYLGGNNETPLLKNNVAWNTWYGFVMKLDKDFNVIWYVNH